MMKISSTTPHEEACSGFFSSSCFFVRLRGGNPLKEKCLWVTFSRSLVLLMGNLFAVVSLDLFDLAISPGGGDGGAMIAVRNDNRFLRKRRRSERKNVSAHLTLLVVGDLSKALFGDCQQLLFLTTLHVLMRKGHDKEKWKDDCNC